METKQKCIIRCDRAGVFYAEVAATSNEKHGMVADLRHCRRVWYWNGAASLSELATTGPKKPGSKITVEVEAMTVSGVIEIIPCTAEAVECIDAIKAWRA